MQSNVNSDQAKINSLELCNNLNDISKTCYNSNDIFKTCSKLDKTI